MPESQTVIARGSCAISVASTASGVVRYLESPSDVVDLLENGDVAQTVVLSRGGAATFLGAVVQEEPAAILTIEGAPESHLGIIAREFGIRTIMSIELVDDPIERVDASGVVRDEYVTHVAKQLDGRKVVIDCSDSATGLVIAS